MKPDYSVNRNSVRHETYLFMTQRLAERTAIVTGAASGIGRAIALRFAQEGATVVVADVREDPREGGEPTHERIRSEGSTSRFVRTDVSDTADLEAVVAEISEDRAKEWISSAQSQA